MNENEHYPFVNTPLPYAYDALEPYIDTKTMELHHDRHLAAYIDNLNKELETRPRLQKLNLVQLINISKRLNPAVGVPISRNAGGVYNHRFYFDGLTPDSPKYPKGELLSKINSCFGDFEKFKSKFTAAALSVFGSGYAWLVCTARGDLGIVTTPNQKTPLHGGYCPILNIDVWEHAYYLKHYNKRVDYISDWFNVVNWDCANERYISCIRSGRK